MGSVCSTQGRKDKCIQSSDRKMRRRPLHLDGRIILKWMLNIKQDGVIWIGFIWLRIVTIVAI
jgi:hypothetical protein